MMNVVSQVFWPAMQNWQAVDWPEYVGDDWARNLLEAKLTDRLHEKQGRDIARWTVGRSGAELVTFVKRHYRHTYWRRLIAALSPNRGVSDGAREWRSLETAKQLGIPTPRPVACAELRDGTRLQSAIVLEELTGMIPLHEAIPLAAKKLSMRSFEQWKRGLIAEMVRLVHLLHDGCYYHRDLYLCHFYVLESDATAMPSDWAGRVVMIDFHRLTRRKLLPFTAKVKDLAQLLYSADVPGLGARDFVRFWRLYRRGERMPWLGWAIQIKARRYRSHNAKHRAA
jgi:heptose I phosphotransferase